MDEQTTNSFILRQKGAAVKPIAQRTILIDGKPHIVNIYPPAPGCESLHIPSPKRWTLAQEQRKRERETVREVRA